MWLVTDRFPAGQPSYASVALDGATQTARCTDAAGQVADGLFAARIGTGTPTWGGRCGRPAARRS
ncbi:hypothetical protein ACPCTO_34175 [Streptomyces olivoreticuli]